MGLALRLARRELGHVLRHRLSGLRIVLACLALGVAAIATVGNLRAAIDQGLASQGRDILGGDLLLEASERLPTSLGPTLAQGGAHVSEVVRMRTMLYDARERAMSHDAAPPAADRMLVELRAEDAAYPLAGSVTLQGSSTLAQAFVLRDGLPGMVAEPVVLDRLGLKPGDVVRLGSARFRVAAALLSASDAISAAALAPAVMIPLDALEATGLDAPGALLNDALRVTLPPGRPVAAFESRLKADWPDTGEGGAGGWQLRDTRDAVPGLSRLIGQIALFMTLVGLSSLLVGGIGIAAGVEAWLETRLSGIAILRCLGAPAGLVRRIYDLQVAALFGLGILAGLLLGAVLPAVALWAARDALPITPELRPHVVPMLLAAGFGALVAACFALLPLGRALRTRPAILLRDGGGAGSEASSWRMRAIASVLAALLVALVVATSPQHRFALGFCIAAALVLALFGLAGAALVRLAARLPRPAPGPGRAWLRLGLGGLHRPGMPAARLLLSLGAGLSMLTTIALIEGNMRREVLQQLPLRAPDFYFIDLQPDELARFDAVLHAMPAVRGVERMPSLRARVVAVDGVPAERVLATANTRWALSGDRGLTIAPTMPDNTHLAAGRWWPAGYSGPPLVSFDSRLAQGWGVHLGSTITLNVLGRDIALRVASLRDIQWKSLQLNFVFVASPGLLSAAPHSMLATVRSTGQPEDDAAILAAVTDALPNVTGIRVADVLAQVGHVVRQLAAALGAICAFALGSGMLVLAGTLAAGRRRRVAEAVVLRGLGAARWQVRGAWLLEFALLGLVSGLLACGVGLLASWGVMHFVLQAGWTPMPGRLALTLAAAVAAMVLAGSVAMEGPLRVPPARLLRRE